MYGTVVRFRPKSGQETGIEASMRSWVNEGGSSASGFLGYFLVKPDAKSGEWLGLVLFNSPANYWKNANDPEQDRWYQQFRESLTDDPVWIDGEITSMEPAAVPL